MGSREEATDYYAILGSAEDASQEEIERLYKRLAIRYHPDRGGDAEYMKAINEAYQVLGNEAARHAYDATRKPRDETPSMQGTIFRHHISCITMSGRRSVPFG